MVAKLKDLLEFISIHAIVSSWETYLFWPSNVQNVELDIINTIFKITLVYIINSYDELYIYNNALLGLESF